MVVEVVDERLTSHAVGDVRTATARRFGNGEKDLRDALAAFDDGGSGSHDAFPDYGGRRLDSRSTDDGSQNRRDTAYQQDGRGVPFVEGNCHRGCGQGACRNIDEMVNGEQ